MEPKEDPPLVAMLRSLLNRNMRIKITDGRVFVGQFMCIDHSRNIILSCANEYRGDEALTAMGQPAPTTATATATTTTVPTSMTEESKRKAEDEKRFVGLVMIPGHHIIRALADTSHLHGSKDPKLPAAMSSLSSTATMSSIYNADYLRGG